MRALGRLALKYTAESLLFRAQLPANETGIINRVTAKTAGWELLNAEVRRLARSEIWRHATGEHEVALVLLGGRGTLRSNRGEWSFGRRPHVFAGMPYTLYLPRQTAFELTAQSETLEVAHCWVPTDQDHLPHLVTPEQVNIEVRGGGNATRQINSIIPPGFDCHRIVCVEVYTPGGNWSSYPGHKHDVHLENEAGEVIEADLSELYYYKIDKPQGYAIQHIYTGDRSLDAIVAARDNDFVLVPEGYHPVSAPWGYNVYYLNFLAGSAQSLACTDDPDHAWVKETWTTKDPRVPLITHGMEGGTRS